MKRVPVLSTTRLFGKLRTALVAAAPSPPEPPPPKFEMVPAFTLRIRWSPASAISNLFVLSRKTSVGWFSDALVAAAPSPHADAGFKHRVPFPAIVVMV